MFLLANFLLFLFSGQKDSGRSRLVFELLSCFSGFTRGIEEVPFHLPLFFLDGDFWTSSSFSVFLPCSFG